MTHASRRQPQHRPADRRPHLWAFAETVLARMVDWFGAPAAIAALGVVNRRFAWDIAPWLKSVESLVRRLVIAEALALAPRPPGALVARSAPRAPPPRAGPPPWRGRLRIALLAPGPRLPVRPPAPLLRIARLIRTERPLLSEPKTLASLPFARRLDALVRAIENPRPYACRLAARLRRANGPRQRLRRPRLPARAPYRPQFAAALRDAHALADPRPPRRESG